MKRLFVIFLLLFLPVVAGADNWWLDSCVENGRYKSEYTIDRRCYVTKEQKQQSPYNAVVALLHEKDPDIIYCTGTIVKRDDGYFLYTAKHCTDSDNRALYIELQDGRRFAVNFVKKGKAVDDKDAFGDWAIYKIPVDKDATNIPYAKTDSFKDGKTQLVGYGNMGIISDEEIKQIKDDYVNALIKRGYGDDEESLKKVGYLTPDGGILDPSILFWFRFANEKLKVSNCELSNGMLKGCQAWRGNSGGPLFNDHGEIMGILSQGRSQIGGTDHARASLVVGVYSDNKTNGRFGNWVASAGEGQTYYTSQKQYYERQEREAEEMRQNAKRRMQDDIRQNQQDRMDRFYLNQQNKQMMMNMNKRY